MQIPEFIITCLGNFTDFSKLKEIAAQSSNGLFKLDEEFSIIENDDRMTDAFQASYDRVENTMYDSDWENIESHTAVAYFIVENIGDDHIKTMETALQLVGKLIKEKLVTAVKCDSSGIAHGLNEWLGLSEQVQSAGAQQKLQILYKTWVRKPLAEEEFFYSCGMHLFGKPDFILSDKSDNYGIEMFAEAFKLSLFSTLIEKPTVKLIHPEKAIHIYEEDHPYFNKYGYLKVVPV